jgi:hypothetical protein
MVALITLAPMLGGSGLGACSRCSRPGGGSSCAALTGGASGTGFPSDAQLAACFRAERPAFAGLRDMMLGQAQVGRIERQAVEACVRSGGCRGQGGGDAAQSKRLLELLRATGADVVTRAPNGGAVVFSIYARGISPSGRAKAIEWRARPPDVVVADTDRDRPTQFLLSYARLADDWYIAHSSN